MVVGFTTTYAISVYHQCLSPLMLWVRFSIRVRCITLCDKVCQWLATGRWFSSCTPVSSTNKTDRHDITEILLKAALNTIKQTNNQYLWHLVWELNPTVLEFDVWVDKWFLLPRRNSNSYHCHWCIIVPIAWHYVQCPRPLGYIRYVKI